MIKRVPKSKQKKKFEFSKLLILQESALLWFVTIAFVKLAYHCITNQYFGELPWLTAMASLPWIAYGVGQGFYYRKAEKENTKGGIKYDSIMKEYDIQQQSMSHLNDNYTNQNKG